MSDLRTIDGIPCCGECYYTKDDDAYCRLCPLHAAAPELLEACHKARALLAGSIPEEDAGIVRDALREAIGKAEGGAA